MLNVEIGSVWRHLKTGHIYIVVGECLIEASVTDAILYRRCDGTRGPVWCRPLSEFTDGRFVLKEIEDDR